MVQVKNLNLAKSFFKYGKINDIRLGHGIVSDHGRDGIDETIDLLSTINIKESLKNIQLLWEYARWVLEQDGDRAVKVPHFNL